MPGSGQICFKLINLCEQLKQKAWCRQGSRAQLTWAAKSSLRLQTDLIIPEETWWNDTSNDPWQVDGKKLFLVEAAAAKGKSMEIVPIQGVQEESENLWNLHP